VRAAKLGCTHRKLSASTDHVSRLFSFFVLPFSFFLPWGPETKAKNENRKTKIENESIPVLQVCPHPLTPSPKKGEGEPNSKSLSRSGRGI
jgi:hypothetical protein